MIFLQWKTIQSLQYACIVTDTLLEHRIKMIICLHYSVLLKENKHSAAVVHKY